MSVNEVSGREAHALPDAEVFAIGNYRFRYCQTPHLPHGWDAGEPFEETQKSLLCSDLFHQTGDVEPLTSADVVGRSNKATKEYRAGITSTTMTSTPTGAELTLSDPDGLSIAEGQFATTSGSSY